MVQAAEGMPVSTADSDQRPVHTPEWVAIPPYLSVSRGSPNIFILFYPLLRKLLVKPGGHKYPPTCEFVHTIQCYSLEHGACGGSENLALIDQPCDIRHCGTCDRVSLLFPSQDHHRSEQRDGMLLGH